MPMPRQKPGRSKQDYGTPWPLIRAIENRWGPLSIDLAARADNAKARDFITSEENSLAQADDFGFALAIIGEPKDCMLTLWGSRFKAEPVFQTWRWDALVSTASGSDRIMEAAA